MNHSNRRPWASDRIGPDMGIGVSRRVIMINRTTLLDQAKLSTAPLGKMVSMEHSF